MNDTPEASSIAAQSAQQEDEKEPVGFFKRLFAGSEDADNTFPPIQTKLRLRAG